MAEKKEEPLWLIWFAILIAGLLLLADAYGFSQLTRVTARFGIALVYTAIALFVGGGRWPGTVATVIVWAAVLLTFVV